MYKFIQRRTYTFLNTCYGFSLVLTLTTLIIISVIFRIGNDPKSFASLRGSNDLFPSTHNFKDNIGSKHVEPWTSYGSIDVVYTWVNGSDPIWQKKKEIWAEKARRASAIFVDHSTLFNLTSVNATDSNTTEPVSEDDTMSSNRYRDSEELRYSLRSLLQHAPWIHHIYLVTDNQIPNWLNLETNRLSIVTHDEIFTNKSHLPVFSSPAIEANIHHIPGLSKKFIYFNDDVFLGRTITPADFVALEQSIQHFVMAWDVPKCAPGCSESWIGDGFCDKACNVSSCNFDFPDCINGTNVPGSPNYQSGSAGGSISLSSINNAIYCSTGCPDSWLHDKICDMRCNNPECGYDLGDCGIDLVYENYPNAVLYERNSILYGHGVQPEDKSVMKSVMNEGTEEDLLNYSYGDLRDYYMDEEEYLANREQYQSRDGGEFDTTTNFIDVSNSTKTNNSTVQAIPEDGNTTTTSTTTTATMSTHHSQGFVHDDDFSSRLYRRRYRTSQPRNVSGDAKPSLNNTVNTATIKKDEMKPALQVMYGTKAISFDISSLPCYLYNTYVNVPHSITATPAAPAAATNMTGIAVDNNSTTESDTVTNAPTFAPTAAPTFGGSIPYIKTLQSPHHRYQCPFLNNVNQSEITFQYTNAISTDSNNHVIQHASILSRHHMLTVLLYYGQTDVVKPTEYPVDVWFTITGDWIHSVTNEVTGNKDVKTFSANLQFLLRIEDPKTFETYAAQLQAQHGRSETNPLPQVKHQYTELFFADPLVNVSKAKNHTEVDIDILGVPLITKKNIPQETVAVNTTTHGTLFEGKALEQEGLIVSLLYNEYHQQHHSLHYRSPLPIGSSNLIPWSISHATTSTHSKILFRSKLTLFNGTYYRNEVPLQSLLLTYDDNSHSFASIMSSLEDSTPNGHILYKANHAYEQYIQSFFAEYSASIQAPDNTEITYPDEPSDKTKVSPNDMFLHLRTIRKHLTGNNPSTDSSSSNGFVQKKGILLTIPLSFTAQEIAEQFVNLQADIVLVTTTPSGTEDSSSTEHSRVLYSISSLFHYGVPTTTVSPTIETSSNTPEVVVAPLNNTISTSALNGSEPVETAVNDVLLQESNITTYLYNTTTESVDSTTPEPTTAANMTTENIVSRKLGVITSSSGLVDYILNSLPTRSSIEDTPSKQHESSHHSHERRRRRLQQRKPTIRSSHRKNTAIAAATPTGLQTNPAEVAVFTRKLSELLDYASIHPQEFANSFEEYYYSSHEISPVSKAPFPSSHDLSYDTYHAHQHRRRLVDTYASSLIYVNRLYNKKFGTESRKVPAHVPHMIDREYMVEMQSIWKDEWALTSSHRFRHEQDMQYAFAYYYYALSRHKLLVPTNTTMTSLETVLAKEYESNRQQSNHDILPETEEAQKTTLDRDRDRMIEKFMMDFVDHNNDQHIDYNELRTLLILFTQKEYHLIAEDTMTAVHDCVKNITHAVGSILATMSTDSTNSKTNPVSTTGHGHGHHGSIPPQPTHTTTVTTATSTGHVSLHTHHYEYPTIAELLTCPMIVNLYIDHVHPVYAKYYPLSTTLSDRELVAFEMISDNMTTALSQLDSIRMRQNKFICLNDNMQQPSKELVLAVQQFLASMFPVVSPFELPPGQYNPTLYIDEYRRMFPHSLGAFADRPYLTDSSHGAVAAAHSHIFMPEDVIDWFFDTMIDNGIYIAQCIDLYIIQNIRKAMVQIAYWVIQILDDELYGGVSEESSMYETWTKRSSKATGRVRVSLYNATAASINTKQPKVRIPTISVASTKSSAPTIATAPGETKHTHTVSTTTATTTSPSPTTVTSRSSSSNDTTKQSSSSSSSASTNHLASFADDVQDTSKGSVEQERMVQAALWIMVLGVFGLIYMQRELAYQQQKQRAEAFAASSGATADNTLRQTPNESGSSHMTTNNTSGTLPVVIPPTFHYLAPIPKFKGAGNGKTNSANNIPPPPPLPSSMKKSSGTPPAGIRKTTANAIGKLLLGSSAANTKSNKSNKSNKQQQQPQKKLVVVEEDYLAQLEAAHRNVGSGGGGGGGNNNAGDPNKGSLAAKYKQQKLSELDKDDYQEALRMMANYDEDEEGDEPPITIIPFISNEQMIRTSQSRVSLSTMLEEEHEERMNFANM